MAKRNGMSFSELCTALNRGPHFIRHIQRELALPVISSQEGYPRNYRLFLERVIYLRVFGVPLEAIAALFAVEKKLMHLLKVDTANASPLWYLASCECEDGSQTRLLLSNFELGPWIRDDGTVQYSLDFGAQLPELFKSAEMGEDILRVYRLYREQSSAMARRLRGERQLVRDALEWVHGDALRKA